MHRQAQKLAAPKIATGSIAVRGEMSWLDSDQSRKKRVDSLAGRAPRERCEGWASRILHSRERCFKPIVLHGETLGCRWCRPARPGGQSVGKTSSISGRADMEIINIEG